MITELLALPPRCVWIVVRPEERLVYVGYTLSIGSVLGRLYEEFSSPATLRIESAMQDEESLRLHTEWYWNQYRNMGYSEWLPRGRKTIEYKVRIVASSDFRFIDVELVAARGRSKVVGRFKNRREALDFMQFAYGPDNDFRFPVYAFNDLTKSFLAKETEDRLIDIGL